MNLLAHLAKFIRDEEGQDLIEYALIVALISIVCVAALKVVGTSVSGIFNTISGQLSTP